MKTPETSELVTILPRLADLDDAVLAEYAAYAVLTVEAHLYHAVFETWADGTPVDPVVQATINKAVAFQIQAWVKDDVKPWKAPSARAASVSLGPASVTYETGADASDLRSDMMALDPFTAQILRPLYRQPEVTGYGWTA